MFEKVKLRKVQHFRRLDLLARPFNHVTAALNIVALKDQESSVLNWLVSNCHHISLCNCLLQLLEIQVFYSFIAALSCFEGNERQYRFEMIRRYLGHQIFVYFSRLRHWVLLLFEKSLLEVDSNQLWEFSLVGLEYVPALFKANSH